MKTIISLFVLLICASILDAAPPPTVSISGSRIWVTNTATGDATTMSGKVGIGTLTPAERLDVLGNGRATNFIGILNVKYWGAVGNGSTDDYLAIQATLNAAESLGFKTVYIPASTYKLTNQITLGSNVRLAGDGPASVLDNVTTNDYIITAYDKTNIVIENLSVKGHGVFDNSTAGRAAIKLGINPGNRGSAAVLRNLWIYNSGVCGLNVDAWSDVIADGVFIYGAAEHGVYLTDVFNARLKNIMVLTNGFGTGCKMVNCTNTVVNGTFNQTENAGGLFDTGNIRCVFEGCLFYSNVLQGVRVNAGNVDCTIRDCDIYHALQDEVRLFGGTNTTMIGNRIYAVNRGIVSDAASASPIIDGNFVQLSDSSGPAIMVNSKSIIRNNTVTNPGLAIEIDSLSTNTVLSGNTLLTSVDLTDSGVGTILSGQTFGTNTAFTSRVGIGTVTPATTLDVTGDFHLSAEQTNTALAGTGSRVVEVDNLGHFSARLNTNTIGGGGPFVLEYNGVATNTIIYENARIVSTNELTGANLTIAGTNNPGNVATLTFKDALSNTTFSIAQQSTALVPALNFNYGATPIVQVAADGSVGVGLTNPGVAMDVAGDIRATNITASGTITATNGFIIKSNTFPIASWSQLAPDGCITWKSNGVAYLICTNSLAGTCTTNPLAGTGGGSQTPWTADEDAAGFGLSNVGNITATNKVSVGATTLNHTNQFTVSSAGKTNTFGVGTNGDIFVGGWTYFDNQIEGRPFGGSHAWRLTTNGSLLLGVANKISMDGSLGNFFMTGEMTLQALSGANNRFGVLDTSGIMTATIPTDAFLAAPTNTATDGWIVSHTGDNNKWIEPGGGTVTSVAASGPAGFTWSAAVTGSGTLTATTPGIVLTNGESQAVTMSNTFAVDITHGFIASNATASAIAMFDGKKYLTNAMLDSTLALTSGSLGVSIFPRVWAATSGNALLGANATYFFAPNGNGQTNLMTADTSAFTRNVLTRTTVLQNFYAILSPGPGASRTTTFTVMTNGVASSITFGITGSATTGNDTTHTETCIAGVEIGIRIATVASATAGKPSWSLEGK